MRWPVLHPPQAMKSGRQKNGSNGPGITVEHETDGHEVPGQYGMEGRAGPGQMSARVSGSE